MEPHIVKASGQREPFSEAKLRSALARSGAPADLAEGAVTRVRAELHEGITTNEIYDIAFTFLRGHSPVLAGRYALRRAIMELGPEGHPFERLVGEILESQGYTVQTGVVIEGRCVSHEVDVVAENAAERVLVECKFHNDPGIKSDVKVALYVQARFDDIKARAAGEGVNRFHATWLVTNTKLSSDAVRYARCMGMRAIAWGYPQEGNLAQLIEQTNLQPVTVLASLGRHEQRALIALGVVTCAGLRKDPSVLAHIGMKSEQAEAVMKEVAELCGK